MHPLRTIGLTSRFTFTLFCALAPIRTLLGADSPPTEGKSVPLLDAGVDTTLDGAISISGGRQSGRALNAMALAHLAWNPPSAKDAPLTYRGYASAMGLFGHGPTESFVGNLLTVTNSEARPGSRVYALWLEAQFDAWSLRAGSLLADEEFCGTQTGANFTNSAFGWPAFISANTVNTGPAFYVPAPGLRLRREFGEAVVAQIGVYDGDSFDSLNTETEARRHGLHYRMGGAQGHFLIAETAFTSKATSTQVKLGAWWHTARFDDVFADSSGRSFALTGAAPRTHRGNYGAYGIAEQTLSGVAGKPGHVSAFVRGGIAPADRNLFGWAADAGLAWLGAWSQRPADSLALGFVRANHSGRWAASQRDANPRDPRPDFEEVIELSYSAPLTEHFSARPSVQFIRHPGGSSAQRDAAVLVLRCEAHF